MSRIDHLYRMMSTATPDECALWPHARSANGYGFERTIRRVQNGQTYEMIMEGADVPMG